MTMDTTVILGKSAARDRGPIHYDTAESSCSNLEPRNYDSINGSSIQDACVVPVEDDKRGIRKAQALKANLAKRKQQQRARSVVSAASTMPTQ